MPVDKKVWWGLGIGGAALAAFAFFKRDSVEEMAMSIVNRFASKDDFIRRVYGALDRVAPTLGTWQKTVLVAQAIHEASWGAARASKGGFNYWNLTAGSRWKGPVLKAPDTEFATVDDKNPKTITQSFRVYGSDEEAARDMLSFIGPGTRYDAAWNALQAGDLKGYIYALHDKGFFTQPPDIYLAAVQKFIPMVVSTLG